MSEVVSHEPEIVALASLKPHPRNYRGHPDDQRAHLAASLVKHGAYRNIVIARDGTILAGHGVVEAARKLGVESLRAVRLPIDPDSPAALQVLIGDNEIEHLAEQDDRLLSELLKEIGEVDTAELLGTGYDEQMLANLVYVTRPASEIRDFDEAAHWVGLPEHGEGQAVVKLVVSFDHASDRQRFMEQNGFTLSRHKDGETWSVWWPEKETEDLTALQYTGASHV